MILLRVPAIGDCAIPRFPLQSIHRKFSRLKSKFFDQELRRRVVRLGHVGGSFGPTRNWGLTGSRGLGHNPGLVRRISAGKAPVLPAHFREESAGMPDRRVLIGLMAVAVAAR